MPWSVGGPLEAGSETGGLTIYCKPRHKGNAILSQISVGGSPCEVASQYKCPPNQERELSSITLVTIRLGTAGRNGR